MSQPEHICHACGALPATAGVKNRDARPFLLGWACQERTLNLTLRPGEWYRLAVIHGPWSHYLHDDFYDEHGKAQQPKARVVDARSFPAPTLADMRASLDGLLEFCSTRFTLSANHHLAL